MRLAILLAAATLCTAVAWPARAAGKEPSRLETALLADVADRHLDNHSLLDAGLIVSGVEDEDELAAARARIKTALKPLVAAVDPKNPRAGARALLRLLHTGTRTAPPMMKTYEAHASTLLELLNGGRFNCVSATLLYLIAAREVGFDARAVLLPSHARAVVIIDGQRTVVETTSPAGYDATAETSREVQRRFRPARAAEGEAVELYADEKGTEVDDIALLGVVYTNLAVAARQKGDLEAAAALDSRAELFVDPSAIPMLHLVRASMLGELAIEKLDLGKTAEAVGLAMLAAQIAPAGEDARLALHNLRAMAQRRLEELSKGSEDRALLDFADRFRAFPDIARDLRSRAWTLIGIARNERGDLDGAAAAAREAARLGAQSGSPVLAHNVGVAEINRVLELAKTDPERAWTAWQTLAVPPDLAATRKQLGATIASARAQRALETHRCADLDRRVEELAALSPDAPGDALRASCRNDEGLAHWKTGDFVKAAASFREALRIKPDEGAYRRNLGGALAQRANKLLQTHRCAEAMKVVEEGRSVAPEDPFFDKAAEYCDAEKR